MFPSKIFLAVEEFNKNKSLDFKTEMAASITFEIKYFFSKIVIF